MEILNAYFFSLECKYRFTICSCGITDQEIKNGIGIDS